MDGVINTIDQKFNAPLKVSEVEDNPQRTGHKYMEEAPKDDTKSLNLRCVKENTIANQIVNENSCWVSGGTVSENKLNNVAGVGASDNDQASDTNPSGVKLMSGVPKVIKCPSLMDTNDQFVDVTLQTLSELQKGKTVSAYGITGTMALKLGRGIVDKTIKKLDILVADPESGEKLLTNLSNEFEQMFSKEKQTGGNLKCIVVYQKDYLSDAVDNYGEARYGQLTLTCNGEYCFFINAVIQIAWLTDFDINSHENFSTVELEVKNNKPITINIVSVLGELKITKNILESVRGKIIGEWFSGREEATLAYIKDGLAIAGNYTKREFFYIEESDSNVDIENIYSKVKEVYADIAEFFNTNKVEILNVFWDSMLTGEYIPFRNPGVEATCDLNICYKQDSGFDQAQGNTVIENVTSSENGAVFQCKETKMAVNSVSNPKKLTLCYQDLKSIIQVDLDLIATPNDGDCFYKALAEALNENHQASIRQGLRIS